MVQDSDEEDDRSDDLDMDLLMEDDIEIETESRDKLRGMEEEVPAPKESRDCGISGEIRDLGGRPITWTLAPRASRDYDNKSDYNSDYDNKSEHYLDLVAIPYNVMVATNSQLLTEK